MRFMGPVILFLLVFTLAVPSAAEEGNRIGYVNFEGVTINLHDENAVVEVEYTLDPGMPFFIFFFGTSDLQRKAERAINFPGARVREVTLDHAVFTVDGISENYGDRAYWFPARTFGITFPRLTVRTDGTAVTLENAQSIPRGFGYFGDG